MKSIRKITAIGRVVLMELFRRRDVYAALILALVLLVPLTFINFFGVEGIVRHLREASLLLIWIFSIVITITTAARQFPGELQRRTIFPLLAHPVRRREVVAGKFFGSFAASGCALLLFYLCYAVLIGLRSGIWFNTVLGQAVFLHLLFVFLLTAMTLAGSLLLTPAANITCCSLITVGMLLFGEKLPELAEEGATPVNWVIRSVHYVFPHFEFYDSRVRLIHEWGSYDWSAVAMVLVYTVVYTLIFLILATLFFNRKKL